MDALEKAKRLLANMDHAAHGSLDEPVPYPDIDFMLGDLREIIEIVDRLREQPLSTSNQR